MVTITKIGFSTLEEAEQNEFTNAVEVELKHINHMVPELDEVIFHLKEHSKSNANPNHELHAKFIYNGKVTEVDTTDRNLLKALNLIFKKIAEILEHKLHLKGHHK
ncbi:MAG: hypothetical protein ACI83O_000486 [Patescibacteria group bacterium]|jgi:hypothetical protein